jgi:hypothetical protein
MKVANHYTLDAAPERIWPHILNPSLLMKLIPGCQQIEQVSPTEYHAQIRARLAAIVGTFRTVVRLVEYDEPHYCSFEGVVTGPTGSIRGSASFKLQEVSDHKTLIEYQGNAIIGGALMQLSARFVEGVADTFIKQGLAKLNQELQSE